MNCKFYFKLNKINLNSAAVGLQSTLTTLNNLMININHGVNNLFNRLTNQLTNVAVSANNAAQSGVQSLNNGAQAAITNVCLKLFENYSLIYDHLFSSFLLN